MQKYRVIDDSNNIVGYFEPVDFGGKKNKVALVIGHDGHKQGAYGKLGISEWEFNRELVYDELIPHLDSDYVQMFLRDPAINGYTNQMVDLHKRIDAWGASYSIEFHFNGSSNESVNGHEILYCSSNGEAIAKKLDVLFDKYLDNNDRNIKKIDMGDNGGGFVCRGASTCILAEPFFGEHQDHFKHGSDMRKNLVKSYVEFVLSLV